jgi:predicted permease
VTVADERASRFITGQSVVAATMLGTLGAIVVVVLMACVNLATMSLARGAGRTHEINVRLALGASRRRLLRQLATESLLVSGGAMLVGLGVVAVALRLFAVYRIPEMPAFNLAIDGRVVACAIALALFAPVLFGLAPGAHVLRLAIMEGLKHRPVVLRRRRFGIGARELLIVVQTAASFALLVSAALFAGSVMADTPALRPRTAGPVAVVPVNFNNAAQSDEDVHRLTARLLDTAARLPDVDRATAASIVPLTGSYVGFRAGTAPDRRDDVFDGNLVAPGYFEVVGIPLRTGRSFDDRDHARAPRVAIVSESLARQSWGSLDAVGRYLHREDGPVEVVGVVADAPYRSVTGEPQPVLYLPLAQSSLADSSLVTRFVLHARVRNAGEAVGTLGRALRDVDPRIVLGRATTLDQMLDETKIPARATQWIGGLTGLLQLGLALMATWGLVAYAVERRTAEIAIRRALGATEGGIVRLLMRPGLWLLAPSAIIGCGAGVLGAQVIHANFIGLAPIDLWIMCPAILVLAAVVVAATWWPARRAMAIAPASALKQP